MLNAHHFKTRTAPPNSGQSGFTLIELSIVLVIIGLIVGGVLTGQSLIKGAKTRAALTQITHLNTAVNTFHDRYGQLPGDLTNFAAIGMTDPNCAATTCVTGDGLIEDYAGTGITFNGEVAAFMSDLSTASMMNDVTATTINAYPTDTSGGAASPSGTLVDSPYGQGYYLWVAAGKGDDGTSYPSTYVSSNWYHLGSVSGIAKKGIITDALGMSPVDAAAIDSKLDDGVPSTGRVLANNMTTGDMGLKAPGAGLCAVSTTVYDTVANPTKAECSLVIQADF